MKYESAFHATNDKRTADELTAKMDLIVDIIQILNKFKIEDISTDKLLNILEILEGKLVNTGFAAWQIDRQFLEGYDKG